VVTFRALDILHDLDYVLKAISLLVTLDNDALKKTLVHKEKPLRLRNTASGISCVVMWIICAGTPRMLKAMPGKQCAIINKIVLKYKSRILGWYL
jgi:hypothetical protein